MFVHFPINYVLNLLFSKLFHKKVSTMIYSLPLLSVTILTRSDLRSIVQGVFAWMICTLAAGKSFRIFYLACSPVMPTHSGHDLDWKFKFIVFINYEYKDLLLINKLSKICFYFAESVIINISINTFSTRIFCIVNHMPNNKTK